MLQTSHEVPLNYLEASKSFNDFDYCLDFFWDEKGYIDFFRRSIAEGRFVIFDNSYCEFKAANIGMDFDKYRSHIMDLKPSCYLLPDGANAAETKAILEDWFSKIEPMEGVQVMGVVHGENEDELVECYEVLANDPRVGWIGITFTCDRVSLIKRLLKENKWNYDTKVHLLGCSNISSYHSPIYDLVPNIISTDTSYPITSAVRYFDDALRPDDYRSRLYYKQKINIIDIFHSEYNDDLYNDMYQSVIHFRDMIANKKPFNIMVTGTAGSGKTTLNMGFIQRCHGATFMKYTEQDKCGYDYRIHHEEYQKAVTKTNAYLVSSRYEGFNVFDRGVLDNLAYAEMLFEDGKIEHDIYMQITKVFETHIKMYNRIFLIEPLSFIEDDGKRLIDQKEQKRLHNKYVELLRRYDLVYTTIPDIPVDDRINIVLENI